MKFSVKPCGSGKARIGLLQLSNCPSSIETPAFLLSTRKGLPLFLSPDLLSSLPFPDSRLLQISPLHLVHIKLYSGRYEEFSASIRFLQLQFLASMILYRVRVESTFFYMKSLNYQEKYRIDCPSPKAISNIGGLHQMLGLHEYGFAAAPRDSILCLPKWDCTNKIGASFETPFGRRLISPVEYVEMIASMKPDIWVTLADEVPAWVSEKRNKISVNRTLKWLDECITLCPVNGSIFGAIVGGSNPGERKRCAKEVAKRNISGYWISGFGLAESIDDRSALLNAVTDHLGEERPRQICGLGLPDEVLMGVAAGIDLFDSTYIYELTIEGFGLTFPLDPMEPRSDDSRQSNSGQDTTKINLKETLYSKDTTPIVVGCSCYTCQNHTKAYVNHLLNVHEIHNTHHYLGFFRAIRHAIQVGKFEQLQDMFVHAGTRLA